MSDFTNDATEQLMLRIAKLPVDEQIHEVKRTLIENTDPGEILSSIAFAAWIHAHRDRIVEMAIAGELVATEPEGET